MIVHAKKKEKKKNTFLKDILKFIIFNRHWSFLILMYHDILVEMYNKILGRNK